jgi:hypothetical protein
MTHVALIILITGRQTTVLKSSAAADAQPQACFSLLFNGLRALHIEEESRDRLPLWLDSIHQLLSLLNRRVVVDEAWPTADDRGRHFLIEVIPDLHHRLTMSLLMLFVNVM